MKNSSPASALRRYLVGSVVASALLALPLSGFAQTPLRGGTLVAVSNPGEPPVLTTAFNQAGTVVAIATKLFDGLVRYGKDLKVEQELAESWTLSNDGKETRLKVHPRGRANFAAVESLEAPDPLICAIPAWLEGAMMGHADPSWVSSPANIKAEELAALIAERDALAGALRVATTERDLALERLRSLQRQLFAAKSEARGTDQKDLFLNEAEALAPTDQTPPAETGEEESTPVAGHQRKKRGRKPLDPALPREIVRHELPECHTARRRRNRGATSRPTTSPPLWG